MPPSRVGPAARLTESSRGINPHACDRRGRPCLPSPLHPSRLRCPPRSAPNPGSSPQFDPHGTAGEQEAEREAAAAPRHDDRHRAGDDRHVPPGAAPDRRPSSVRPRPPSSSPWPGRWSGMALGQLVIGPLSDSVGRRRPLLIGVSAHVVASLAVLAAPTVEVLGLLRVMQGFGAAASADDRHGRRPRPVHRRAAAAQVLSRLMLVMGARADPRPVARQRRPHGQRLAHDLRHPRGHQHARHRRDRAVPSRDVAAEPAPSRLAVGTRRDGRRPAP